MKKKNIYIYKGVLNRNGKKKKIKIYWKDKEIEEKE